jgi:hypothetical protein
MSPSYRNSLVARVPELDNHHEVALAITDRAS